MSEHNRQKIVDCMSMNDIKQVKRPTSVTLQLRSKTMRKYRSLPSEWCPKARISKIL